MAKFTMTVWHPVKQEEKKMYYDNTNNSLTWENGTDVIPVLSKQKPSKQVKIEEGKDPNYVKILLGLSCNYECEYCNQRFVPHSEETNQKDIDPFVDNMHKWFAGGEDGLGTGSKFEFWGGEPLVYWKTLKPLAERIRKKYPFAKFGMITNGSLLDDEKNSWLEKLGFNISVSHDGPGQFVRGPDPFDDPKMKDGIIDAFKRFAPAGRMSFNTMLNNKNYSRVKIEEFFINKIKETIGEEYVQHLRIGEGAFVDAYDEGGEQSSLSSEEEEINYRNTTYNEIREGKINHFMIVNDKANEFIEYIKTGVRSDSLGQKCGMDKSDTVAMDLNGNVLTCQNVSSVSVNPSGISHLLGTVDNLKEIKVNTGTHWSDREECPSCPVLHLCKGACFFLTGSLWETTCNNAYSDNVPIFAATIEAISGGWVPIYIDGPLREDRKDIFWWVNGKPEKTRKAKKIIPIMAV
jgi:uncharacterized protein